MYHIDSDTPQSVGTPTSAHASIFWLTVVILTSSVLVLFWPLTAWSEESGTEGLTAQATLKTPVHDSRLVVTLTGFQDYYGPKSEGDTRGIITIPQGERNGSSAMIPAPPPIIIEGKPHYQFAVHISTVANGQVTTIPYPEAVVVPKGVEATTVNIGGNTKFGSCHGPVVVKLPKITLTVAATSK